MEKQEEQWESVVRQAEQMERKARQRAIVFSLIPVILAGLLLWFTGYQIQQGNRQLVVLQATTREVQAQRDEAKAQLVQTQIDLTATRKTLDDTQQSLTAAQKTLGDTQHTLAVTQDELEKAEQNVKILQQQLDDLNKRLDEVSEQLRLATDFSKYQFLGDWSEALKSLESQFPRQGKILLDIHQLQRTQWKLGGSSPDEGFDSPSFAAFVLGQNGLIKDPAYNRDQLRKVLPSRPRPLVGDVVFYQAGYTMFYFEYSGGSPFVIGMTPLGVLALRPDFAPVISYGAVDYSLMR